MKFLHRLLGRFGLATALALLIVAAIAVTFFGLPIALATFGLVLIVSLALTLLIISTAPATAYIKLTSTDVSDKRRRGSTRTADSADVDTLARPAARLWATISMAVVGPNRTPVTAT